MRNAADIASLTALIAEPARANILIALMGGTALTATELALEAGVTPSTASSHLARLTDGKLLRIEKQGRHRYFRLLDDGIAEMLESLMGIAARDGRSRRTGPADPRLRAARICYDHLAGESAVWMLDTLLTRKILVGQDAYSLSAEGERFVLGWGVDLDALSRSRRPLCRSCLDWSERRHHLAGALGAAILRRLFTLRWARRELDSRAVTFSAAGERSFRAQFEE
jgi:DNA-binding transcriptional ArsR family regulator